MTKMWNYFKFAAMIFVLFAGLVSPLGSRAYAEIPLPHQQAAVVDAETLKNRILEPGDKIKIIIYPADEYIKGGVTQVSSEGNITLPLIGKVYVAGMKLVDVERKLVEIIDADYIIDPEVVIELKTVRVSVVSVSVLGAVKAPGSYEVETRRKQVTLVQAILRAGGFSDVANIKKVKIVRKDGPEKEVMRVNAEDIVKGKAEDIVLKDGDIIHVAESLF